MGIVFFVKWSTRPPFTINFNRIEINSNRIDCEWRASFNKTDRIGIELFYNNSICFTKVLKMKKIIIKREFVYFITKSYLYF